MNSVIAKTFGGLSPSVYARHLLFGLMFPALVAFVVRQGPQPVQPMLWALMLVCTVLYPYARFAYEGIVGFILGKNVFFTAASVLLFAKFMTMGLCWLFAPVVAPLGLAWLYHHHGRSDA